MIPITLDEVARITGGRLLGSDGPLTITGAEIDSRRVSAGDLFVALPGEFLDGHDFTRDAFQRGAVAALVAREVQEDGPLVVVDDTLGALTTLAAHNRDVSDPVVVGITGSTGKTSTKDLAAAVLSHDYRTVASPLSFNTETGVPLTLLRARLDTEVVVCEMGAQRVGEIAALCRSARPHVGVVTNVGVAHHGFFGSSEAIAAAKSELPRSLPEGGTAVLNADDRPVAEMASITPANVITFGRAPSAEVRAAGLEVDDRGRCRFVMAASGRKHQVQLRVAGLHQVYNALAAAAAGIAMGMEVGVCADVLERAGPSPWRMEVTEAGGVTFVNDAYNSNPASVIAALETCASMKREGRFVAVLGYMAELGEIERSSHLDVGRRAALLADRIVVVGEAGTPIAEGADAEGGSEVVVVADPDAALDVLADVRPGDVVLFKASRVVGLEKLAARAAEAVGG